MAPHSSTLAWKIPWTEEPGRLAVHGVARVGHDWATSLSLFTFMHWRRKWQPLQCSCLENPRDGGAWWAAVYGVAQSRTRLKRRSSSSSSSILLFMIWQQTLLSNEKSHLPNHTHSSWVDMYNTDSTIHLPQARETAKTFQVFICLLRKQQCYGGK